jgi:phthiocerol/phenolphthiocerol synthesis type-I polyketide synthase E
MTGTGMTYDADADHIAVIGYAGRFPGADTVDEYWRLVRDGRVARTEPSDAELDEAEVPAAERARSGFVRAAYAVADADAFDAEFFGVSPREAALMDPQHRIFLECAWHAFEHAGRLPRAAGSVGVFGGTGLSSYLIHEVSRRVPASDPVASYQAMVGNDKDFLATRVSYRLGLTGPSMSVQSACSTSLLAVHLACQSLLNGECDTALAGGVSVPFPQHTGYRYEPDMIMSPDGYCRPFDRDARGTVRGGGAGVVLLKPLAAALADGDTVHGIIRGSAVNNDGADKLGYTAPSRSRQIEVLASAYEIARVSPARVGYVEAHGTGTPLGDPVEVAALAAVFGPAYRRSGAAPGGTALGSVKANIGHLDVAAGIAGLIKVLLMLRHKQIPPQPHFHAPNPAIELADGPFVVATELSEWSERDGPRLAGVSSTGIGGTNVHVVVQEAAPVRPGGAAGAGGAGRDVVVLSARTARALDEAALRLADRLADESGLALADVASTLHNGREAMGHRRAFVAESTVEAARLLRESPAGRVWSGVRPPAGRGAAFLFPGQGSQKVGMGRDLWDGEPVYRDAFAECAELFRGPLGHDLRALVYPDVAGDSDAAADGDGLLRRTDLAQAAIFTASYAVARLWQAWGVTPSALLGHSIGEYVAACLSGVFSLPDAVTLVSHRGRLMRTLAPGAMLAVPLSDVDLAAYLGDGLELAAVNGADRCVVAGPLERIAAARALFDARGVRYRELATSHAFHTAMVEPAARLFRAEVARMSLAPPRIPLIANRTGDWMSAAEATDPGYWAAQMREPVRFHEGLGRVLRLAAADGVPDGPVVIEVGPFAGLADTVRRHPARGTDQVAVASLAGPGQADAATLAAALGRVWAAGVDVDWRAATRGAGRPVPLPGYPFARTRHRLRPLGETPATVPAAAVPIANPAGGPATPANPVAGGTLAPVGDWFWVPSWRRAPASTRDGAPIRSSTWLVVSGPGGGADPLAEIVAAGLVAAGGTVRRTATGGDYRTLLAELGGTGHLGVVHLAGHGPADDVDADTFFDLVELSRALGGPGTVPVSLVVVTSRLYRVHGGDRIDPGKAPIHGLATVLPQELERVGCRTVDLAPDDPAELAGARVLTELDQTDPVVCWRGRDRWLPDHAPLPLPSSRTTPVRHRGGYLITGGLGGVGLRLAGHLARTAEARLVLVGRTARDVSALVAAGAQVEVVTGDVADEATVRRAVDVATTRFGGLHGVIHAAGVAGPAAVAFVPRLSRAACADQFQAKVRGTRALAAALAGRPLDFCLLVSSNATVLGGPGLAAYAAANAYLDATAEAAADRGEPWLSASWDPWPEPDPASSRRSGRFAMTAGDALDAVDRLLAARLTGHVVVSTGRLPERLAQWRGRPAALPTDPARLATDRATPAAFATDRAAPAGRIELQRLVVEVWRAALGVEAVGLDDSFFDLGGDSLAGLAVIAELERRLGVRTPVVALYEAPTVRRLAELIGEQLSVGAGGGGGDGPGARPDAFDDQSRRAQARKQAVLQGVRRREAGSR